MKFNKINLICLALSFLFLLNSSVSFALAGSGAGNFSAGTKLKRQNYGPVADAETPWSIAKKIRPNKAVSIHQTVVALFILNPDSFTNKNINRMVKGRYLLLPTLQDIEAISAEKAAAILSGKAIQRPVDILAAPAKLTQSSERKITPTVKVNKVELDNSLPKIAPTAVDKKNTSLFWILGSLIVSIVLMAFFIIRTQSKQSIVIEEAQPDAEQVKAGDLLIHSSPMLESSINAEVERQKDTIKQVKPVYFSDGINISEQQELLIPACSDECSKQVETIDSDNQAESIILDEDSNTTKIKLAKAYLNLSDKKGAKVLLCEVLEKGNQQQISIAKQLMNSGGLLH